MNGVLAAALAALIVVRVLLVVLTAREWARLLFWLSGKLRRVRTPQRVYRYRPPYQVTWRWRPCSLSVRLLGKSIDLDPGHWEHWAPPAAGRTGRCAVCGGHVATRQRS